jgi:hypothetical protein
MHWNDLQTFGEEQCTMTCTCGAVFEVVASRQESLEHVETYLCPVCARPHTTLACLPPRLSLIIAPAGRIAARPVA